MRICIVGAGAIGSYLACRLARSGVELSVLARYARAAAIRARGITTTFDNGDEITVRPLVAQTPEALPVQQYVLVCVKAYAVPEAAVGFAERLDAGSRIVFVQNGIPWWYGAEEPDDPVADLLDPGGRLAAAIPLDRVVGCVTYANVRNAAPGIAEHVGGDSFVLGEPRGGMSPPLGRLAALLSGAGIDARTTGRIRDEVWLKLWGSLAFNPISALTGMTMDEIIDDPATRPIVIGMMTEGRAVATEHGVAFPTSIEQRLETASQAGRFKTSMLQDLEAGRRLEIDAIIGAVAAMGRQVGVPTPTVDVVLGLLEQKARGLGLGGRSMPTSTALEVHRP